MINIKNIKKSYGKNKNNKIVLNNINIKISEGEILGLLGPNGAGKTTLTKIICGLIIPDDGEVEILNLKLNINNQRKIMDKVGVVLEGARNLHWRVTVKDNYYYLGYLKGKTTKEIEKNIKKYSDVLNIGKLLDQPVKTLSLGEKQKVSIIACLLHDPEVILLDEPSNGLDIESKTRLANMLKYINNTYKTTIIITSHDTSFLNNVVNKYIIINNGEIKDEFIKSNLNITDIEKRYNKCINQRREMVSDEIF